MLFTGVVCDSDYVTSNGLRIVTNGLERRGEDVVIMVWFKLLTGQLSGVIEGRQETPQIGQCPN
jgi:hypothetical protein